MSPMEKVLWVMERLRSPQGGCPWDLEQHYATIVPYTLEEAYEVADAVERQDYSALKEELGDLLFQVVYYCQFAHEEGRFDFAQVAGALAEKMIARHPHVFGDAEVQTAAEMMQMWEGDKAQRRAEKATEAGRTPSLLDDVPLALPGLLRAIKLQKRAARVGFDWTKPEEILNKLDEELGEFKSELDNNGSAERLEDELGDLLFVMANLARRMEIDPERALRRVNAKFERRFRHIESMALHQGRALKDMSLAEMEDLWQDAKRKEREVD